MKTKGLFNENGYNEQTKIFKSRYYAKKWLEARGFKNGKIIKIGDMGYMILYLDKN